MRWAHAINLSWLEYERHQVVKGALLSGATLVLMYLYSVALNKSMKIARSVALGFLVLVIADVTTTAKTYYISQVENCVFETRAIQVLKSLLGTQGLWRTRTLKPTMDEALVMPGNTSQIFYLHTLDDTATMYPRSYSVLKQALSKVEGVITAPVERRSNPSSDLGDLMCTRYLLTRKTDGIYSALPVLEKIALMEGWRERLGLYRLGKESHLGFWITSGESLVVGTYMPRARSIEGYWGVLECT